MANLVDVPSDGGNANRAIEALTKPESKEERREAEAPRTETRTTLDPRFVGKSIDDVVSMYRNLESHDGRLANELGRQRHMLDTLLMEKRSRDLGDNGGKPANVEPTDLLQNPQEVLSNFVSREIDGRQKPIVDKLAQLETALAATTFKSNHPDYTSITSDQEFLTWSKRTPYRNELANRAGNGDIGAADALMTEWKDWRPANAQRDALSSAERIGFESTRTRADTTEKPVGKKFRRSDLIKLNQDQPERYAELSDSITQAYLKGQVDLTA